MKALISTIAIILFLFGGWSRSLAWEIPRSQADLYLPVGINLGSAIGGGFILGAELSLTRLSESWFWFGGYGDALWDFEEEAMRSSGGLQAGFAVAGLEAGYLFEYADDQYRHGLRIGGIITLGVVSAYFRWGHLFNGDGDSERFEAGALLKFPFY